MELFTEVADQYTDFAGYADDSPCFEDWASRVAQDEEVCAWIATLPPVKQQPNLVFAAARWHGVPAPGPYAALRTALLADAGPIRETILARATQTNEVGRLATLVPAFAVAAQGFSGQQESPIALLEVGASAGLCLYPDRWSYRWETEDGVVTAGRAGARDGNGGPTLTCRVRGKAPLPAYRPEVVWRGGIDLNPLDVTDDDAMGWLTTLVWPEHDERRERLETAIAIARQEPPTLVAGDLLEVLPELVAEAGAHGPVVVFHSAVIAYLEPDDRRRFEAMMAGLVADGACHWVSNEGKGVHPAVTATGPPVPDDHPTFVLGLDGRALAWTHGHGRSMTCLPPV